MFRIHLNKSMLYLSGIKMEYEYIKRGYRKPCNDIKSAFKSMFRMHNETVNAWSMVVGVLVVTMLTVLYPNPHMLHYLQLTAIWIHLPLSFMYHTLQCSPQYSNVSRSVDIMGVLVASSILTLTLAILVFGACHVASFILCFASICLVVYYYLKVFGQDTNLKVKDHIRKKTILIIGIGVLIYNIPMIYLMLFGNTFVIVKILCLLEILSIASAALLYWTGFPESRFPNTFDLIGNSHNLAHMFLIIQQICIWLIITNHTSYLIAK